MEKIEIGSFAEIKAGISERDTLRKMKNKEEVKQEKEKEEAKKAKKKQKKEAKSQKKEAKKQKKEVKEVSQKESSTSEKEIPEPSCSTRVELVATDVETGVSTTLVSTDYGDGPAQVPPRENVPVVALSKDGRVEDASLEEKIRSAAERRGIILEGSDSPIVAALVEASAANVKKGSNSPKNVGRNVVRITQ